MRTHPIDARRRSTRAALACTCAILTLALGATGAAAQYVRGGVFQSDTGEPVGGALVVLVGPSGESRVSALTNEAGRFVLNAREAGTYSLRVQRIGFRDVVTPPFEVLAGTTVERDVPVSPQAIILEGITAEARRRCVTRPREGLAVATLWEEARKALTAAVHTERTASYRFRVSQHRRELDAGNLRIRSEESRVRTSQSSSSPFVSLPAERLLRDGFMHLSDTVSFYYAPDAHVLLSDEFLDAYCMRVAEDEKLQPDLVGLAFEPSDRRGPPAVRGTLWLDRRTLELRHLEYNYTRVTLPDGPSGRLGGRVEFERLSNGEWIVRRWWIRMPEVQHVATPWRAAGQRSTPTITGLIEDGGEVIEILDSAAGIRLRAARHASVSGVVFDSVAGAPLAGAVVDVVGTSRGGESNEDGRFSIAGIPEGAYAVTFTHPRTALYGFQPPAVDIAVGTTGDVRLDLGIPSAWRGRGLLAECPADALTARPAIVRGTVRDEFTNAPVPGARVTFSWQPDDEADAATRSVDAGPDGRFIACGLPEQGVLTARVSAESIAAEHTVDAPGAAGLAEHDLALQLTPAPAIVVIAVDHESGRPVADASVSLPSLGLRGVTNRSGRVSFEAVRPGTHEMRVEHIAYGTHASNVVIGTAAETFEVAVPARAIALQGIEVSVRSVIEEARRTRGVRINVMQRDEIARLERSAEHVGHLAQRIPGLRMEEVYHGLSGLRSGICIKASRGSVLSGEPCVVVILDGVPLVNTEALLSLGPDAIEAIEFLNPLEAGPRYGTAAGQAGVLLIWSRGKGPYARPPGGR